MSKTVYKYRVFCETEQQYVYVWNTSPPSQCPNDAGHTISSESITVVDTVSSKTTSVDNLLKTPFEELIVMEKTPVMELKSMYGKSALRDIYTTTGTGTITNEVGDGEYRMRVTGASSLAQMQTTERGRYIAGHGAEVGIGVRMPSAPTGNIRFQWGLYDESNGFYFVRDTQGFGVCILRNGVESRVNQSAFNRDKLDGTGPSGVNLSFSNGHIYQIVFSWYGYGIIKFQVSTRNPITLEQETIPIHSWFTNGQTSVKNPNLPIQIAVSSGIGDATDISMFATGRQYSILGKYMPITRINAAYILNHPVTSTSSFQHVVSVRRKAGYAANAVKVNSLDYFASAYMILQLRVNTSVSGGSFVNLPDQDTNETIMECNLDASSASGGIVVWTGVAPTDRVGLQQISDLSYTLPEYQTLTLFAKAIATNNGSVSAVLRFTEEW